jgi:hypothetical protein
MRYLFLGVRPWPHGGWRDDILMRIRFTLFQPLRMYLLPVTLFLLPTNRAAAAGTSACIP